MPAGIIYSLYAFLAVKDSADKEKKKAGVKFDLTLDSKSDKEGIEKYYGIVAGYNELHPQLEIQQGLVKIKTRDPAVEIIQLTLFYSPFRKGLKTDYGAKE